MSADTPESAPGIYEQASINFEKDCNIGRIPTICDMVNVGAYIHRLQAERDRLAKELDAYRAASRELDIAVTSKLAQQATELKQAREALAALVEAEEATIDAFGERQINQLEAAMDQARKALDATEQGK